MITMYVKNPVKLSKSEKQVLDFFETHNINIELVKQSTLSKDLLILLLQEYHSYARILTRQGHIQHADKTFSEILTSIQVGSLNLKTPIIHEKTKITNTVKDLRRFVSREQRLMQARQLCEVAVERCGLAEEDYDENYWGPLKKK